MKQLQKHTCPHCGKPINPASILRKGGWAGVSKKERSKRMSALAKKRWITN